MGIAHYAIRLVDVSDMTWCPLQCNSEMLLLTTDRKTVAVVALNKSDEATNGREHLREITLNGDLDIFSPLWLNRHQNSVTTAASSSRGYLFVQDFKRQGPIWTYVFELDFNNLQHGDNMESIQLD